MIIEYLSRLAIITLLASISAAVRAEPASPIALGQTINGKAGSETVIYSFFGEPGMTVTATLSAPGQSGLVLYTPTGEEMVTQSNEGSVTLEAILPKLATFYIGVVRRGTDKPYTLKLEGVAADSHLALFSEGVGYASQVEKMPARTCWITPGQKKKWIVGKIEAEAVIGRNGSEFISWKSPDGQTVKNEREVKIDGDQILVRNIVPPTNDDDPQPLSEMLMGDPTARFVSYLCE